MFTQEILRALFLEKYRNKNDIKILFNILISMMHKDTSDYRLNCFITCNIFHLHIHWHAIDCYYGQFNMQCCDVTGVLNLYYCYSPCSLVPKWIITWGRFNIMMPSDQYKDSHHKDDSHETIFIIITWLCGFWQEMTSIFSWQRA